MKKRGLKRIPLVPRLALHTAIEMSLLGALLSIAGVMIWLLARHYG